ncbi:MAG TPA: hypothetical protein PLF90_06835 [bacterium]|nr:hypothetical protein [bacterium]
MKLVFIGGAHRHLGIIRAVLDDEAISSLCEICLYDLNKVVPLSHF